MVLAIVKRILVKILAQIHRGLFPGGPGQEKKRDAERKKKNGTTNGASFSSALLSKMTSSSVASSDYSTVSTSSSTSQLYLKIPDSSSNEGKSASTGHHWNR